jgi:hypothetical protein
MKDKFETSTGGEIRDNGCHGGIYIILNGAISLDLSPALRHEAWR